MTNKKVTIMLKDTFFPSPRVIDMYKKTSKKLTRTTMVATHTIPDKIYHFTHKDNLESIKQNGFKEGYEGGVFVSKTLDSCYKHLKENYLKVDLFLNPFTQETFPNTTKAEDYIIIEATPINTQRSKWLRYIDQKDHNEDTLFYLGEKVALEDMVVYTPYDLENKR